MRGWTVAGEFCVRARRVARACLWLAAASLLAVLLGGCQSVGYYFQAIHGQAQILHREHAIATLLKSDTTPEPLKAKLRTVLEMRGFAEQNLRLPADGHYLAYADLGRTYAVWTVYAAPEFSLTPKSWWYPVVGRLNYRGYFSEKKAREFADKLKRRGFDVYVGGVTAYSTLGWFHDPVLNTFINYDNADLAELLFHELAHQRLFIAGDTEFNEAFATTVAEEGVRRWLRARGSEADVVEYELDVRRHELVYELIARARAELEALYDDLPEEPPRDLDECRRRKHEIVLRLRRDYLGLRRGWGAHFDFDRWFSQDLNHAQLNTIDTYHHLVPAFRRQLQSQHGDLEAFFKLARGLERLDKAARRAKLEALGTTSASDQGPVQ